MRYDLAVQDRRSGLSLETIRQHVPAVFATEKASDRTDRYGFVNTVELINALADIGYVPTQAMQQNARGDEARRAIRMGHTRHLLRFAQRASLGQYEGLIPEIVMKNDSMGGGSYVLMIGMFRIVCQNGLITMTRGQETRVRHTIYSVREIVQATLNLAQQSLLAADRMHQMESIQLQPAERIQLAQQAIGLRYPNADTQPDYLTAEAVLEPRRRADRIVEGSLAGTYNIVQENIERGQTVYPRRWSERSHKTRGINAIEGRVSFNQNLYTFAETIRRIHAGESLDDLAPAPAQE